MNGDPPRMLYLEIDKAVSKIDRLLSEIQGLALQVEGDSLELLAGWRTLELGRKRITKALGAARDEWSAAFDESAASAVRTLRLQAGLELDMDAQDAVEDATALLSEGLPTT